MARATATVDVFDQVESRVRFFVANGDNVYTAYYKTLADLQVLGFERDMILKALNDLTRTPTPATNGGK